MARAAFGAAICRRAISAGARSRASFPLRSSHDEASVHVARLQFLLRRRLSLRHYLTLPPLRGSFPLPRERDCSLTREALVIVGRRGELDFLELGRVVGFDAAGETGALNGLRTQVVERL